MRHHSCDSIESLKLISEYGAIEIASIPYLAEGPSLATRFSDCTASVYDDEVLGFLFEIW